MGVKDWLARRAGPSGFGSAFGASVIENGVALGRWLFLGHGSCQCASSEWIVEDDREMIANGYQLYCNDPENLPQAEDDSELSLCSRAAGVAFAARLATNAASNYFRELSNREEFNRAMGARVKEELQARESGVSVDLVLHFSRLLLPPNVTRVLNLEKPGDNDVFGELLREVATRISGRAVAFRRRGPLGFDIIVVPLGQETVLGIHSAAEEHRW
jgi:hypothetical protein